MTASEVRDVGQVFQDMDWAFSDSKPRPPHDIHPYPARFISDVPAQALALVADLDGDVLDPFCGAGTTLVEALRVGRKAVGIDLNPIATLISRVKVEPWTEADDRRLDSYAVDLRWAASRDDAAALAVARERIPRLDHWFDPQAQSLLASATGYVQSIDDAVWRDRIAVAISAAVVRFSRQDSDTRYAAVDKKFDRERAAKHLETSLVRVADQLRGFAPFHSGAGVQVHTADASRVADLVAPQSVAAAVFSPPYPNAYEYWLYHKYRMHWLGYDPIEVRRQEWGARPHYSGSGTATIETFRAQMVPVMHGVASALRRGGICLVVVGDSLIKGELVDNAALFEGMAHEAGLRLGGRSVREIRANRKSFNLSVSRARHEHVLLFQR